MQFARRVNGERSLCIAAMRLEKAFGGSAEVWLRMPGNYDLAQVRARGKKIAVRRRAPASA
jgi:plasmid maintenance system antidote protein VapI